MIHKKRQKILSVFAKNTVLANILKRSHKVYLTLVGEEHIHLSGGQKQLLALARALYRKPQLLLLDEATSAMDSKMESFVLELLTKIKSGMIILMITHKHQLVKQAVKTVAIEKTS